MPCPATYFSESGFSAPLAMKCKYQNGLDAEQSVSPVTEISSVKMTHLSKCPPSLHLKTEEEPSSETS
jgi:hypothetical protein